MKKTRLAIAVASIAIMGGMTRSSQAQETASGDATKTQNVTVGDFSINVPSDWKRFTAQESATFERQYRQQSREVYQHFAGADDPSSSVAVAAYHTPGSNGSFVVVVMSLPPQADLMPLLKQQIEPKMQYTSIP